jgi:hypothetical protein
MHHMGYGMQNAETKQPPVLVAARPPDTSTLPPPVDVSYLTKSLATVNLHFSTIATVFVILAASQTGLENAIPANSGVLGGLISCHQNVTAVAFVTSANESRNVSTMAIVGPSSDKRNHTGVPEAQMNDHYSRSLYQPKRQV